MSDSIDYKASLSEKVLIIFHKFDTILETHQFNTTYAYQKEAYKYSDRHEGITQFLPGIQQSDVSNLYPQYDEMIDLLTSLVATVDGEELFPEFNELELPKLKNDLNDDIKSVIIFMVIARVELQWTLDDAISEKQTSSLLDKIEQKKSELGKNFYYEFTDGDIKRIQELINELREQLTESTLFDEDHKRRLLSRLEKLQAELHKRVSNLDFLWGSMGDAGVALGKFGEDAKPFVDRIKEIIQIGWRTQAHSEELSTDSENPLLVISKNIEHKTEN